MIYYFGFDVWAARHWKVGACVIVLQVVGYMLTLSFVVSVSSLSNLKPSVMSPTSII